MTHKKKMCVCVSVCLCTDVYVYMGAVWSISGETANVSAPWLISFNYSGWTRRAHQQPTDSSICVPSPLITGHSWIIHLPFIECDILPSTKAVIYHTIHTLLITRGLSQQSFQMQNYSIQNSGEIIQHRCTEEIFFFKFMAKEKLRKKLWQVFFM